VHVVFLVVRREQLHQKKHKEQLRGSPFNVVVWSCSNTLHSCSNAPKLSTALTQLQMSPQFQSSILVVDLENEVMVYGG
jgi:hypothetical protein